MAVLAFKPRTLSTTSLDCTDLGAKGAIAGRGLEMRFKGATGPVVALDNLDISIAPGELLALLSQSGCGKSTLLNIFAGIHKPSSGTIEIDGVPVKGPNPG